MNCIILDDEPLARKGLREYIADASFLNLVGEFDHPLKAMDTITREKVELVFLDIQMPRMTGIEWIKSLPHPPMIIFTTAYPQYALEGFELNAVDYLLKPFSFDRFWKAILKARALQEGKRPATAAEEADHFFIKTDGKLIRVNVADVLFIEALQNYVAIHTRERKIITYLTLQGLEAQLPEGHFIKTHKSFLVAVDKVESIEGNEIGIGSHRIPISRAWKDSVVEKLTQNRLFKRN